MGIQHEKQKHVVVLGGPNGAGKSTSATLLLRGALLVDEFVNADTIALGISGFAPEAAAFAAGRVMLGRLKNLALRNISFAFETTLASKTFAPWLSELKTKHYRVDVIYLWLPSADMAVARVADRVKSGGHNVPESIVRRRYLAGLRNFFDIYQPLADSWQIIDNSKAYKPNSVAVGSGNQVNGIKDELIWNEILAKRK